ncbi:MAG: carboxypeptidase-like regulatory domain-containing protein [Bacteroidaceae bacterium]|nr:carboxypeptidase-like regulatory domain-containing protein [Bacteroidaceae bacterium]
MKHLIQMSIKTFLVLFLWVGSSFCMAAETKSSSNKHTIYGKVFQVNKLHKSLLSYATIFLPKTGQGAMSDDAGRFKIENVAEGKVQVIVQSLGMVTVDTIIHLKASVHLEFNLVEESFRLKEVTVTAKANKAGQATSSSISQMAMQHLQAVSLMDVMSLIPGGESTNPGLDYSAQMNIRSASTDVVDENLSGLGASIIRDGAPLSNNANMQSLNPTISGSTAAVGGLASPGAGIDLRSLSVANIESIEVIRGIPSVEYGDLTSGAVLIHSKAGKHPLRINSGVNSSVYQVGASKGFELAKDRGVLNISGNYAYSQKSPTQSYLTYQRFNGEVVYSKPFLQNRLRTNTSVNIVYGADRRKRNPDDEKTQTSSKGSNFTTTFNTNGTLYFKNLWLKNLKYTASASYSKKSSYYQQLYTSATAPYSMTTTDGAILSNRPNTDLYDAQGNKLTNISDADRSLYAQMLYSEYLARYDIDGKEIGAFAKLSGTFFKQFGPMDNKVLVGANFKTDGNRGEGKTYDPTHPPRRSITSFDAVSRPRSYKDIPFVHQFSLFAEENMTVHIGKRNLKIQAGLRWDNVSEVKNALSPRFNASLDVIPNHLIIRGGYGVTAKAPTTSYLHPENAYFEYLNLNEMGSSSIPEEEQRIMTTTHIYNTKNNNLEMAKNKKAEIGFDVKWKKMKLGVTAFTERLANGYSMGYTANTFHSFLFNEYQRAGVDAENQPYFELKKNGTNAVLSSYYTPTNNRVLNSKGIEMDLNLGRFDAIRTAVSLNGSWIRTESYTNGYTFFDGNSSTGARYRNHIAMYEKRMQKRYFDRMVTALRITHNIPQIGFVVTLTMQTIWKESNWYKFGNDSIPVKYIDKTDGKIYDFDASLKEESAFKPLIRQVAEKDYIKESFAPIFAFNLNVTKEIGPYFRMSFFANNFFRSYPVEELNRDPGTYKKRNNSFFFGMNLSLTI